MNTPTRSPRPKPAPRPRPQVERPARSRRVAHTNPRGPRGRAAVSRDKRPPPQEQTWQSAYAWRWWLIGLLLAATLVAFALLRAPFFAISEVQLSGESRTNEGTIRAALAIEEDQPLATFDIDTAEAAVAELPWVEQVQITRGWPSTLRVQIRERLPAAAVATDSSREWAVVSGDGHVLERRLTPPRNVPLVVAPGVLVDDVQIGAVAGELAGVLAVSTNVPAQLKVWVDSWTVDSAGSVAAELTGSARAVFGSEADHRTQYVSLASILNGGTSLVCVSEIDLTIADTPVVDRDRACLTASASL